MFFLAIVLLIRVIYVSTNQLPGYIFPVMLFSMKMSSLIPYMHALRSLLYQPHRNPLHPTFFNMLLICCAHLPPLLIPPTNLPPLFLKPHPLLHPSNNPLSVHMPNTPTRPHLIFGLQTKVHILWSPGHKQTLSSPRPSLSPYHLLQPLSHTLLNKLSNTHAGNKPCNMNMMLS